MRAVREMGQATGVLEEVRQRVVDYILARRNDDGGYTSVQFTDSNARDTFLALATLRELDVTPPNEEQTVVWLRSFPLADLGSIYYVNKSLCILEQPLVDVEEIFEKLRNEYGGYGTLDVDVESTSELETTMMSVELMRMLNKELDGVKTTNFVLKLKNPDGGFGKGGISNLISTYHALRVLSLLDYEVKALDDSANYVVTCASPSGGFTVKPGIEPAFMESTYAGFMSLKLLERFPECLYKTADFVLSCLNSNGGFRRSLEHGISSFENTYCAISILKDLGVI